MRVILKETNQTFAEMDACTLGGLPQLSFTLPTIMTFSGFSNITNKILTKVVLLYDGQTLALKHIKNSCGEVLLDF